MKKIIINTLFFLPIGFTCLYVLAQSVNNDSNLFCSEKIDSNASTPDKLFHFNSSKDAISQCAANINVTVSDKEIQVLKSNKLVKERVNEFAYLFSKSKNTKASFWIMALLAAKPDINFISYSKKEERRKSWLLFGDVFDNQYSIWFWDLSNSPDDKSKIKQWKIIDLADKSFNPIFCNKLKNDTISYNNSHIEEIIDWGLRPENNFEKLTIHAVLGGDCLSNTQTDPSQKNLNTIDLREAFVIQNGRPKCVDEILSSGITENNPFSYLIETDKGWYAWNGDSARKKQGYEPYLMKVEPDEIKDLTTNPDEAWFRLKNYQAILLENISGYKTYVNKTTNDIYCIKSETNGRILYQPMDIRGDSSASANKIKESLNKLTRANYHENKLIRKVIEYWKTKSKDHYVVHLNENISGITITQKDIDDFPLVTIYNEIGGRSTNGICLYGWLENDNSGPDKLLRCNFCKYLSYSDTIRSALFGSSSRILGVKKITDSVWNVCLISHNLPDCNLSIFKIDTSNKNETTKIISKPLDNIFGSDKNSKGTKNKYLETIWMKVASKPGYSFPPEGADCDDWVIGEDILDNFLKTKIIEPLLKNEPAPIIRQILPECIENSNDESPEKVLLHNEDKVNADTSFIPACFKHENTQQGKWKYLAEEGDILKRYFSNSTSEEVPWINEVGIKELKSAWFSWLALANNKVKIVSNLCDGTANTDSIRVCLMLNSAASLYSWLGRSSNSLIPIQNKIIASSDYLFLRPAVKNIDYLAILYNQIVTPQEKNFYCKKADSVDFKIADHFESPENSRCVLYHTDDDKEYKVNCISNIDRVDKRKIYFTDVLKEENPWKLVCSVYNTNKFRKAFGDEAALYPGSINSINTYWGSPNKFGMERGNEVEVFTKYDGEPGNIPYRFTFKNSKRIVSLVDSEYYYVTFSAENPGEISNYFYSWVNDDYRKGKSNPLFWRANPLGYFDRLK